MCNEEEGWQAYIDSTLQELVDRTGPGAFDWWGHNIAGVWPEQGLWLTSQVWTNMLFEQVAIARTEFPQLVDYAPLASFADQHDIGLYAYIGMPRADEGPQYVFDPVPAHSDPDQFMNWYGELLEFGFRGIGHDFSASLPEEATGLSGPFTELRNRGIEVFVESVPWTGHSYLLGYGVTAAEHSWVNADSHPLILDEADIVNAGGRAIRLVVIAPEGYEDSTAAAQWRFDTALQHLQEGKTVAVSLTHLIYWGHPIEQLIEAAQLPVE
jgi:hypothetical protein